jgi:hypothetical protein
VLINLINVNNSIVKNVINIWIKVILDVSRANGKIGLVLKVF